jgi:hypothetical protein
MKIVGAQTLVPVPPEMAVRIAQKMISEARKDAPTERQRGFVVKFKTWEEHESWHAAHRPR